MKKKILLADELLADFITVYSKYYTVDTLWNVDNKELDFTKYDALVASGLFKISTSLIKKLTNIKIISLFAVGYDNVDLNICKNKNITVSNTPDVLTIDVADLALTLLLSLSRNILLAHNYVLKDNWKNKGPMELTDSVNLKKVGIVGLGQIGKEFAKKTEALSMDISYFGPRKKNNKYKYFNNLKKMAKYVDYLVITCTGGKRTHNLINSEILDIMKKSSYLINVSRGSVVDEKALLKSLRNKDIKGAAIDVFINEPKINPSYKKLKNIILHPHHGSGTYETRMAMAKLSCKNLINFFKIGKPLHKVI